MQMGEDGTPAWVDVCASCGRTADGDMDEDTQEFYCTKCWDEWEDNGASVRPSVCLFAPHVQPVPSPMEGALAGADC